MFEKLVPKPKDSSTRMKTVANNLIAQFSSGNQSLKRGIYSTKEKHDEIKAKILKNAR